MYLNYYGLTEKPFSLTPNPRFIFFSKIHKEAFALLLYGINSRFGFIQLIGEVGTGKTTVLRTLLNQLNEENYRIALIFNPSLSAVDLMSAINREYGLACESRNISELVSELNRFLLQENAGGRTVVLVIDEAQNLAPEVLEQIRMVSNLETESEKLIQIVLAGQPELGTLLEKPELRQINQRIALRYRLGPLCREDIKGYIEHRLDIVGGRGKVSFTATALRCVFRYSKGVPRVINVVCDRALLIAYTEDKREISGRIVTLAFRDVMLKPAPGSLRHIRAGALLASLVVACVLLGYKYMSGTESVTDSHPRASVTKQDTAATTAASPVPPPASAPAEVRESFRTERSLLDGARTALQAFNALAHLWHVPPIKAVSGEHAASKELMRLVKKRKLEVTPFRGSSEQLLRLNIPALLVFPATDSSAEIVLAVTGASDDRIFIAPPILARTSLTRAELSAIWPGNAYLIWRNSRNIAAGITPASRGAQVARLQALLQAAGAHSLKASGRYDEGTAKAVRDFQTARGIEVTGLPSAITLINLYEAAAENSARGPAQAAKAGTP